MTWHIVSGVDHVDDVGLARSAAVQYPYNLHFRSRVGCLWNMALYRQRFDLAPRRRVPPLEHSIRYRRQGIRMSSVVSTLVTRDRPHTVSPRPATPPNMAFQTSTLPSQCNDALTAIAIYKLAFRNALAKPWLSTCVNTLPIFFEDIYPIFRLFRQLKVDQNDKAVGLFQIPLFE